MKKPKQNPLFENLKDKQLKTDTVFYNTFTRVTGHPLCCQFGKWPFLERGAAFLVENWNSNKH